MIDHFGAKVEGNFEIVQRYGKIYWTESQKIGAKREKIGPKIQCGHKLMGKDK